MIIGSNSNVSSAAGYTNKTTQSSTTKEDKTSNQVMQTKKDSVEISVKDQPVITYSKEASKRLSSDEIEKIKSQAEQATSTLKSLVEKLILKQGKVKDSLNIDYSIKSTDAAASISEDGEWGVKAVSDRIVDFAKALSGGDKTKLSELTAAIDEGFKQATKAWGGELPDICSQTYNEVMRKLSDWQNEE
jgi:hypothetical protein